MTSRDDCPHLTELLAEVATGAATGPDRDRVTRHVADCDRCRRELDELSRTADELLLGAPEQEPPAGFEAAVLERIAGSARVPRARPPGSSTRRSLLVAAAVLAAAIGSSAGVWWATADERDQAENYERTLDVADGKYFAAAPLVRDAPGAADAQVGHVFLYDGAPSWLFVVLEPAPGAGPYDVVVNAGGVDQRVGRCVVEETGCSFGDTIEGSIADVDGVRLLAPGAAPLHADLDH